MAACVDLPIRLCAYNRAHQATNPGLEAPFITHPEPAKQQGQYATVGRLSLRWLIRRSLLPSE